MMTLSLFLVLATTSVVLGSEIFNGNHQFGTGTRRIVTAANFSNPCMGELAADEETRTECHSIFHEVANKYFTAYENSRLGFLRRGLRGGAPEQEERELVVHRGRRLCKNPYYIHIFYCTRRRHLNEVEIPPVRKLTTEEALGVNLGSLVNFTAVVLDGSGDVRIEGNPNAGGWYGNIFLSKSSKYASYKPFKAFQGSVVTDDSNSLGNWQKIIDDYPSSATSKYNFDKSSLKNDFDKAIQDIEDMTVTPGYESATVDDFKVNGEAGSFNNFKNGVGETIVIDIAFGKIEAFDFHVIGDSDDTIIFRWGYSNGEFHSGKTEIKKGGRIIPSGGLTPNRLVHVMWDLAGPGAPEGAPEDPLPVIPVDPDGNVVQGATNFQGEAITGYFLILNEVALDSGVIIGGVYGAGLKYGVKNIAGMNVPVATPIQEELGDACWVDVGVGPTVSLIDNIQSQLVGLFGAPVEAVQIILQENVCGY